MPPLLDCSPPTKRIASLAIWSVLIAPSSNCLAKARMAGPNVAEKGLTPLPINAVSKSTRKAGP